MKRRSTSEVSLPSSDPVPTLEAGDAVDATTGARRDPVFTLRDRIAASGAPDQRWSMPHLGSPALWLLDEPLLFGAVLVAVLLLGLALGARLFHTQDERRLIVPTVVVQSDGQPAAATAPPARAAPANPAAVAPAFTAVPTALATVAPAAARPLATPAVGGASPAQAATAATPGVPPPAAGPSLSNIVTNAARQPAPAGVPPPAAGFPVGGTASGAGATSAGNAGSASGATTTNQPPDLDAAFQSVVTQGRRAATAAAQRGPAPAAAPTRSTVTQPAPQH